MGFFSRLFERRNNPLEDPSKPMTAGVLNSIFGWAFGGNATAAGEVISEYSALQHVSVYASVRVLAEAVGSLTLRTYRREAKGRSEATDDPIWKMLSLTPNDEMSAAVLWENVVGCLALCGNSYLEIIRDMSNKPAQLYPLHPLKTEPVRLPNGALAYRTTNHATGGTRIINAADVLHFRLFSWDGLKGLSPIQQARQTIGWSTASLKQSARFFGQGSKPHGLLTPIGQVDEQDLVNMRQAWELANGGENQGRTAVLPSDWRYTQLGISQKESQWLESMQFSRSDIAALFRVPPHMIGDTSRLSNNNVESQNLGFVLDTLRPYLVKIEQEIAIKMLGADNSRFVEFDVSERLRGDFQTTMQGFAVGRQWGIFSVNDCLEQLGKNPIGPEGDVRLAPVNMINSQLLLTTESIQVQPVGTEPQARALTQYAPHFLAIYKDAVGRVTTRTKRDAETLAPILSPVLQSITELVESEAREQFSLSDDWNCSEKVCRDYLKGVTTRATDWTSDRRDEIAQAELGKAIRSIYYSVYRDAGAALAEKGLNAEEAA